jgi:hypothetical protein
VAWYVARNKLTKKQKQKEGVPCARKDDFVKVAVTLACSNMQSVLLGTPPLKLYYINILHKIEHVKETG